MLSTWEVRSTQITGQGIRSFDGRRDRLGARATLAAVINCTYTQVVSSIHQTQVSMTNNPRQTYRTCTCIWGIQGADKGQQLADTNTEPPLGRFPQPDQTPWSFGEISYWLGLGHVRNRPLGFDGRQHLQPHRGLADLPGNRPSCVAHVLVLDTLQLYLAVIPCSHTWQHGKSVPWCCHV